MFDEFNAEKGSVYFKKGRYKGRYIFALDLYELYEYIVRTRGKNRKVPTLPTVPTFTKIYFRLY